MVLPKSDFKGGAHQTWLAAKSPEKWAVKLEKTASVHGKKYIAMFDDQRVPSFVRLFLGSVWGAEIILGKCRSPFVVRFWVNIFFFTCLWWWCGHGWKTLKNIVHPCWLMGGWISSCNGDWRLEGPIQKCRPAYAQWVDTKPCLGWITPSTHGTTIHDHSQGTIFTTWNSGTPKSSILIGLFIINHSAIGEALFMETPVSSTCVYSDKPTLFLCNWSQPAAA